MSTGSVNDYGRSIADAVQINPAQGAAVGEALSAWTTQASADTWACEAAGLRLRGGKSVPGWCTADLRGRLLAAKGTGSDSRRALVRGLAKAVHGTRGRLPEVGLRLATSVAERRHVLTSTSPVGTGFAWREVGTSREADLYRAMTSAMWHLPRADRVELTSASSLCRVRDYSPVPVWVCVQEVGGGAVALNVCVDAVLLVVPEPGCSDSAANAEVARALAALQRTNRDATAWSSWATNAKGRRRVRVEVARFQVVEP